MSLVRLNALLDDLIEFQDEPRRSYGTVARDAVIGGGLSAVGTAGLLAGVGMLTKKKAPDLSHMLKTASVQHIKVFNPWHTAPMMKSLPEASRLFGHQLNTTRSIEDIATKSNPTIEHIKKAAESLGGVKAAQEHIEDVKKFKKQWGRTPGETMEKSVGLLSGMAATGVGAAGGAALSGGWEKKQRG